MTYVLKWGFRCAEEKADSEQTEYKRWGKKHVWKVDSEFN